MKVTPESGKTQKLPQICIPVYKIPVNLKHPQVVSPKKPRGTTTEDYEAKIKKATVMAGKMD
jgi:hypothetical protein